MSEVTFLKQGNKIRGFQIEGHAGFNKKGPDIVCSALSMLSQNTVFSLIKLAGIKEKQLTLIDDEKRAIYAVLLPNVRNDEAQLLMRSFELGVKTLHKSFPAHVKLKHRRCDNEDDF